jgi:hypothetical protein
MTTVTVPAGAPRISGRGGRTYSSRVPIIILTLRICRNLSTSSATVVASRFSERGLDVDDVLQSKKVGKRNQVEKR